MSFPAIIIWPGSTPITSDLSLLKPMNDLYDGTIVYFENQEI